jgi:4-phytase/acid phosphatase
MSDASECSRTIPARRALFAALLWAIGLAQLPTAPAAVAQEQAAQSQGANLLKVVILSRHGVRSPIPMLTTLQTWTTQTWPTWQCDGGTCLSGQLTPRGRLLSEQMGTYYQSYLAQLVPDQCPQQDDVFFWVDLSPRDEDTAQAILRGFRPACDTSIYHHMSSAAAPDRIFHPVSATGSCTLDAGRAERDILARARGSLSNVSRALAPQLRTTQGTLLCCTGELCKTTWEKTCQLAPPPPNACTLIDSLPSCLVRGSEDGSPRVLLGGALRVASTFTELLLLEYANGFPLSDVGWGRIGRRQLTDVTLVHTSAFDLEQRTPYIAKRQGSRLFNKILLALQGNSDSNEGTAPPDAKFVAYIGHDTNIANLAGMLGLSWLQPGYQRNDTPPAGALIFELRARGGRREVAAFYVAQSLDDMRNATGTSPVRTPVRIPGCGDGRACPLDRFAALVQQALDPDCSP